MTTEEYASYQKVKTPTPTQTAKIELIHVLLGFYALSIMYPLSLIAFLIEKFVHRLENRSV